MAAKTHQRAASLLAFGLAVALGHPGTSEGQVPRPPVGAIGVQAGPFTTLEQEAIRLYNDNRLLTARTKAEEALSRDPDSLAGHYVLGCVLREAEGSLPRAMTHLGRARELYETRYGTTRPAGAPWQVHREILFAIQQVAGEIEQYDYQLHVLEFYDYLYDPDLLAEHAWPLIHLRRYREARGFAQRAIATSDAWQQSLGRNALCAVEGAARDRQAQQRACLDAFQNAQRRATGNTDTNPATAPRVTVHAYNAALGAAAILRFDEVERLAMEGTRRLEFTTANPWRLLARLYLDQGRVAQAVEALREMQRWRTRQPANLRDQDRAETDAAVATVLLVAGEADAALRFVDRAIERPDRRGLVASDQAQALGAHALLRRALQRVSSERAAERGSARGFGARLGGWWEQLAGRARAWPDDERVANVLTDEHRLDSTLRMYVRGGIEPVPVWLVGDLVEVLGAGTVAVALREVRREERTFPAIAPYHDALEAEVLLAQDEPVRALALAQRALGALPNTETALQARVAIVGARAAMDNGQRALALGLLERAMQRDPGALRRMGARLPATVTAAGGALADEVARRVGRSPRLDVGERGFTVRVTARATGVEMCLTSPLAAQMGCTTTSRTRGESDEALAVRAVDQFHEERFATRLGLSTQDLRSLDGTTSANEEAARQQMQGVLRDLSTEPGARP